MPLSKKMLMCGLAAAALATPALAEDRSTTKQKEQYLYQQSQNNAGADQGAIGATKPNSGPGVQGAPDTRTGPATKNPAGSAQTAPDAGSASSGASSGDTGMGSEPMNDGKTTMPSQDSSGVQGFPDTRTGPATRAPSGDAGGASGSAQ